MARQGENWAWNWETPLEVHQHPGIRNPPQCDPRDIQGWIPNTFPKAAMWHASKIQVNQLSIFPSPKIMGVSFPMGFHSFPHPYLPFFLHLFEEQEAGDCEPPARAGGWSPDATESPGGRQWHCTLALGSSPSCCSSTKATTFRTLKDRTYCTSISESNVTNLFF